MAESKQDVIEIKDCEYEIFKEFLRWLYQATVNLNDANQAIKLHTLADKYLQEDLREKCLNFLTSMINMENVYMILDFAHQENSTGLKNWCLKCVKDKLNVLNVAGLIEYLDRQEDSEWKENHRQFRNFAFNFILRILQKEKKQVYEDFLLKNVEMDTISPLIQFLGHAYDFSEKSDWGKREKEIFEKCTARLKEAAFRFVEGNAKVIMTRPEAKDFPHEFLRDFIVYTTENQALKSGKKRMEPSQNSLDEENHELKKTKKSFSELETKKTCMKNLL